MELKLDPEEIKILMYWCLDYHYIKYKHDYFYQHKGIAMGSSCSVSVANLTVHQELVNNFNEKKIIFKGRFIDDIFLIVETSEILSLDEFIKTSIQHPYLKFTYQTDTNNINFLDLKISIDKDNSIHTSIFKKEISKHQYLHFLSDHPHHIFKSIIYSQGIRLLRICSKIEDFQNELDVLCNKFISRDYPPTIVNFYKEKVLKMKREDILRPKTPLLYNQLYINNPEILVRYGILAPPEKIAKQQESTLYFVLPFYKHINNLEKIIKYSIQYAIDRCENPIIKNAAEEIKIMISYKKHSEIGDLIKR